MKYPLIIRKSSKLLLIAVCCLAFFTNGDAQSKEDLEANREKIIDKIRSLGALGSGEDPNTTNIRNLTSEIEVLFEEREAMIQKLTLPEDTLNNSVSEVQLSDEQKQEALEKYQKWKSTAAEDKNRKPTDREDGYDKYYEEYLDEKLMAFLNEAGEEPNNIPTSVVEWVETEINWSKILDKDFEQTRAQIRTAQRKKTTPPVAAESPATTPGVRNEEIAGSIKSNGARFDPDHNNSVIENKQAFFKWPLNKADISAYFGHVVNGQPNKGIDIVSPDDNLVKVIFDGVVIDSKTQGNDMVTIIVKHSEDYYSVYGNLKFASVQQGDKLSEGQLIGLAPSASGGYSLHFEVRKGQQSLNPRHWLQNN